jgi:hypothetical protein
MGSGVGGGGGGDKGVRGFFPLPAQEDRKSPADITPMNSQTGSKARGIAIPRNSKSYFDPNFVAELGDKLSKMQRGFFVQIFGKKLICQNMALLFFPTTASSGRG